MKNKVIKLVALSLCMCASTAVMAERFPDVPKSHWAYTAIENLASKGIYEGYPSTELKGDQPANRYEIALIAARSLAYCEQHKDEVSPEDLKKVQDLCIEFAEELATMGVRIDDDEYGIISLRGDVSELKNEVQTIKDDIYGGAGDLRKVKLSGDILVHNHNFKINDVYKENRTSTALRLQLDANISDDVSIGARWRILDGGLDGLYQTDIWDGRNKTTSTIEVANMRIKNTLGFGGEFKLGRDWYSHGHGLVVHNYMDAVSYTKSCGDVVLTANCFFDLTNSANFDKDYYNIWNINADTDYRGHALYMGLYGNHREEVYSPENFNEFRMEFGSSGKLSNNCDRLTYDLACVYSDTESTGALTNIAPEKHKDEKGWLTHVAMNFDSKKQLTAKIAYTMADDGSNANFNCFNQDNFSSRQDYNSWHDGTENIFDDLSRSLFVVDNLFTSCNGINFKNLSDLKLQVGYTLKKYDKHSFRLAYDMVNSDKDDINGFFSITNTNNCFHKIDFDMFTAEYRYKISDNARIKIVFSNVDDNSQELPDGAKSKNQNILYSEIYSRF